MNHADRSSLRRHARSQSTTPNELPSAGPCLLQIIERSLLRSPPSSSSVGTKRGEHGGRNLNKTGEAGPDTTSMPARHHEAAYLLSSTITKGVVTPFLRSAVTLPATSRTALAANPKLNTAPNALLQRYV